MSNALPVRIENMDEFAEDLVDPIMEAIIRRLRKRKEYLESPQYRNNINRKKSLKKVIFLLDILDEI